MPSNTLFNLLSLPTLQFGAFVAEGWGAARGQSGYADVPPVEPSLQTVLESTLDRTFTLAVNLFTGVPQPETLRRRTQEISDALALYQSHGWLDDPGAFHPAPPALRKSRLESEEAGYGRRKERYQHLTFDSGYSPHRGEPGRERWHEFDANGTAHAYVFEHPGKPRPWLVCVHGFSMGDPGSTFSGFGTRWLHEELGLNLVFPVLPLHGPRSTARMSGGDMLSPDYMNVIHTFAQAVWDIRRVISWIRARDGEQIGLYGISLGGYTSALVASLEDGLDCVVAGIPAVDFPGIARDNEPLILQAYGTQPEFDIDWDLVRAATHVVSPLALDPLLPVDRRFIFAGTGDRVTRPNQARALWRHWDAPEIHWFHSGHVAAMWKQSARDFVTSALEKSGMLAPAEGPSRTTRPHAGA